MRITIIGNIVGKKSICFCGGKNLSDWADTWLSLTISLIGKEILAMGYCPFL